MLQSPSSSHPLFLKDLGEPTLGLKRNTRCPPPSEMFCQGAQEKQPILAAPIGPKAPSDIVGSGVRKAAGVASWRTRRAGKREAETA